MQKSHKIGKQQMDILSYHTVTLITTRKSQRSHFDLSRSLLIKPSLPFAGQYSCWFYDVSRETFFSERLSNRRISLIRLHSVGELLQTPQEDLMVRIDSKTGSVWINHRFMYPHTFAATTNSIQVMRRPKRSTFRFRHERLPWCRGNMYMGTARQE